MQISESLYNPILPQLVLDRIKSLSQNQEVTEIKVSVISNDLLLEFHPQIEQTTTKADLKYIRQQLERRIRTAIDYWHKTNHIIVETKFSNTLKTAYKSIKLP